MGEKELGRALLQLDALELAGRPDVQRHTWSVLEHDRRRIRLLTWATVIVWFAAAAMVLGMLVAFGLLFPFQAHLHEAAKQDQIAPAELQRLERQGQITFQMITLGVTLSVGVLGLAALLTLLLVFASRRATLRQINANLLVISEQLNQLRTSPASPS